MGETASLEEVLALVPELAEASEVIELPGGMTNLNHKVVTPTGAYVVRRYHADTGLLAIDRDNEYVNAGRAAEVGVGPAVIAYHPERNAMVFAFIEGQAMTDADLRDGDHIDAIAAACRWLHRAPRFRDDFNMFDIQPRYLEIVRSRGFRLPDGYEDYAPQVAAIRDAFAVNDEGTVPCNNDLLAGNFILTGDGFRLIDYEYSGNNDACFELGNVWSESGLSLDQLEALIAAYYGRPLRNKVARARLWGVMSKYGWTLWGSIQDSVSDIDFDFWTWTMEHWEPAVAEFDSPEFAELLAEVTRPD